MDSSPQTFHYNIEKTETNKAVSISLKASRIKCKASIRAMMPFRGHAGMIRVHLRGVHLSSTRIDCRSQLINHGDHSYESMDTCLKSAWNPKKIVNYPGALLEGFYK